jgi:hypothetical protein
MDDLVVLKIFLEFFLQNVKGIGEINFQGTGVVSRSLHVGRYPLSVKVKEFKLLYPSVNCNELMDRFDRTFPLMINSLVTDNIALLRGELTDNAFTNGSTQTPT